MISELSWYTAVDGPSLHARREPLLEQGDIFTECPRFLVRDLEHWLGNRGQRLEADLEQTTAIVLSQTCDIVQGKLEEVLLAAVFDWVIAEPQLLPPSANIKEREKYRKLLVRGHVAHLALLHEAAGPPEFPWSIVDFHRLFVLPIGVVHALAESASPRLRLKPPYREHLSQALARYFMRVGLPLDAKAFETYSLPSR